MLGLRWRDAASSYASAASPLARAVRAGGTTAPSLLVVGSDTMLAAAPSTAVQLTHACLAAGFDAVIPASWGDELIAARVLERLGRADGPVVQCSCPLVANRLAEHGDAIAPMVFCFVSPPAATAAYLRALYAPARPRITYAGGCPSAGSDGIDEWLTPTDLLAMLAERGLVVANQPREFDAMLAPDRRRFYSDPGGIPAVPALRNLPEPVEYVVVPAGDLITGLAQELLADRRSLVDVSVALGCACAGATSGSQSGRFGRARIREQEPPRAPGEVLDHSVRVVIDAELPSPDGATPTGPDAPAAVAEPYEAVADAVPVVVEARRRSPMGTRRSVLGVTPQAKTEVGRQLPRAYVARRRSSPKGVRAQPPVTEPGASRPHQRWPFIAIAGVGVGLALAWLMGLVR